MEMPELNVPRLVKASEQRTIRELANQASAASASKAADTLEAKLKAMSDYTDFLEDCIAEMATQVYGGV